jgi:signal transduction histidine kinase
MRFRTRARDNAARAADLVIVVGLVVSAQAEIWTDGPPSVGRSVAALILLAATVPLAWRTTAPLVVAAIVSVALFVGTVGLQDDYGASFQAWVALLLALYSVAAHAERPRRLLGAGIVVASVAAWQIAEALRGDDVEGIPGVYLSLAVAFLLGRLRRWQMLDAMQLRRRAAELEREREEKARLAVAEERARIARELHDLVAHHLSVAIIQIVAAVGELPTEASSAARRHLATAEESCRQSLAEMRRLLDVLRTEEAEPDLAPTPGLGSVEELVDVVRSSGLPVQVAVEGRPVDLPAGLDLAAYRIIQEALTNALKYAGGRPTRVTVRYGADELELEVIDEGRGVRTDRDGSGRGLVGMRERVALYGGRLEAGPCNDGGFRVAARLPFDTSAP